MKLSSLLVGIVIGAIISFLVTKQFQQNSQSNNPQNKKLESADSIPWKWADSLDAVKAAPQNHHVIFENDKIRILEVILKPYEFEQMHTHQFPSVMFGPNNPSPFDIIYYRYGYDSINHIYFVKDSNKQHNGGDTSNQSNVADYMRPEDPHRIKNLSNVKIDVYRVEFKTGEKK
jgi:hypothetical protein